MEEIKLWKIDDGGALSSLGAMRQLENELELEDLLVAHPDLLEPELELVGRQLPAAGGWLDLLAIDATGRLVIYELKRGILGRDAVTQLLDYASALSEMEFGRLATHIENRSGQGGVQQISGTATRPRNVNWIRLSRSHSHFDDNPEPSIRGCQRRSYRESRGHSNAGSTLSAITESFSSSELLPERTSVTPVPPETGLG